MDADGLGSQLLLIVFLILINAFFAMTEMAMVSANKVRINMLAEKGDKKALKLQKILKKPSIFLSTIQVGITLAGFLASAQAATGLATFLTRFVVSQGIPFTNQASIIIITVILSYFTLVFGELVPYGIVWRTGANEPTTFTTGTKIHIEGKSLAAGTYSLWTRPNKTSWDILFNSEIPEWGVTILSGGKETTRDSEWDVLQVSVPVKELTDPIESFTIQFDQSEKVFLSLLWDTTKVSIPIDH